VNPYHKVILARSSYRFFESSEAVPAIAVIAVTAVTATLDTMPVIAAEQQHPQAGCGI
jgi:hypothetical protein